MEIKNGFAFKGISPQDKEDLVQRGDFLMSNDCRSLATTLTSAQKADLWDAVFEYQAGNDTIFPDPVLAGVFGLIRSKFDRHAKEYIKTLKARRKGGKKGGRPKKP